MGYVSIIGAAFNANDILTNFPVKKLSLTLKLSINLCKTTHRELAVQRIFLYFIRVLILDIIDNNITFWLPLTAKVKACIKMQAIKGEGFKRLRLLHKWSDYDIINCNFTGYKLGLFKYYTKLPERVIDMYVNKFYKDLITKHANEGMVYGDSKYDKTIDDYIPIMLEKYPIDKKDMKRILTYPLRKLNYLVLRKCDVIFKSKNLWCYFGKLLKSALDWFYYYKEKLSYKLRVMHRWKNLPWDGYYYFSLDLRLYEDYLALKNTWGRPKKKFTFKHVKFYKLYDDCKISKFSHPYIFRILLLGYKKYTVVLKEITTDKAELIEVHEPLKFKDILVNENDYFK